MKIKETLTEESLFLVLNALLIPFLKKAKGDYWSIWQRQIYNGTVISGVYSLLVSIIVNF